MNYSLNLLKILGIDVARELNREKRLPEEKLFQAIICQAFEDSLSSGNLKQDAYAKQDAIEWFSRKDEDFNRCCWFANFDPEMIFEKFKDLTIKGTIKYTHIQIKWVKYRYLYKLYRACNSKEKRREILKEINKIQIG